MTKPIYALRHPITRKLVRFHEDIIDALGDNPRILKYLNIVDNDPVWTTTNKTEASLAALMNSLMYHNIRNGTGYDLEVVEVEIVVKKVIE